MAAKVINYSHTVIFDYCNVVFLLKDCGALLKTQSSYNTAERPNVLKRKVLKMNFHNAVQRYGDASF